MFAKRLVEMVAMLIIGDSFLCLVSPRRHVSLWQGGPAWWDRACDSFVRQSSLTRMLGLAGVGFGVWLAFQQQPDVSVRRSLRSPGWTKRLRRTLQ